MALLAIVSNLLNGRMEPSACSLRPSINSTMAAGTAVGMVGSEEFLLGDFEFKSAGDLLDGLGSADGGFGDLDGAEASGDVLWGGTGWYGGSW